MTRARPYTIEELRVLDLEAYHEAGDGHLFLWQNGVCVRVSPDRRVTVRIIHSMPDGPWFAAGSRTSAA